MTKAINNYDKTKISMAHVFLQYDQATMIHKYSLDYNSDWLYITFINRTYRICLLYTSPSPRDMRRYRMPSSA